MIYIEYDKYVYLALITANNVFIYYNIYIYIYIYIITIYEIYRVLCE